MHVTSLSSLLLAIFTQTHTHAHTHTRTHAHTHTHTGPIQVPRGSNAPEVQTSTANTTSGH